MNLLYITNVYCDILWCLVYPLLIQYSLQDRIFIFINDSFLIFPGKLENYFGEYLVSKA